MLIFEGLRANLSYNAGQSTGVLFQNSFDIKKKNINSKNNSWEKLTQENSRFDKL